MIVIRKRLHGVYAYYKQIDHKAYITVKERKKFMELLIKKHKVDNSRVVLSVIPVILY